MRVLVAGYAALADLIVRADVVPSDTDVARIIGGPGGGGRLLPGGSAPTVAMAMAQAGLPPMLWHPLPARSFPGAGIAALRRAGVDLSRSPGSDEPASVALMVDAGQRRLAWSGTPREVDTSPSEDVLGGIDHLVLCPRWGRWADALAAAAARMGIPCSVVGTAPPSELAITWHAVVADARQLEETGLKAAVVVATRGSEGADVRWEGGSRFIPAARAAVVDTTGAGDVFAGVFLARLLLGDDPPSAGQAASEAAARVCESWGAQSGLAPSVPDASVDSRVAGALWGLASGDAFGMPNAFLPAPVWLEELAPAPTHSPYHADYPAGRFTDDTEQAIALTDALEDSGGRVDPEAVGRRLIAWFESVGGADSLAVGPSTRRALVALQAGGAIDEVGRHGTTNGGAMRIAPVGILAGLRHDSVEALADAVARACTPTHNTSPAISGAMAVAAAVAAAISASPWPTVIEHAIAGAEAGARRGAWIYAPSIGNRIRWAVSLVSEATTDQGAAELIGDLIGAGEASAEAVPAALAAAAYAGGDPRIAITVAGNTRGDSDTIAAMAGAICGAWSGRDALPMDWRTTVGAVNGFDADSWADRLLRLASPGERP